MEVIPPLYDPVLTAAMAHPLLHLDICPTARRHILHYVGQFCKFDMYFQGYSTDELPHGSHRSDIVQHIFRAVHIEN